MPNNPHLAIPTETEPQTQEEVEAAQEAERQAAMKRGYVSTVLDGGTMSVGPDGEVTRTGPVQHTESGPRLPAGMENLRNEKGQAIRVGQLTDTSMISFNGMDVDVGFLIEEGVLPSSVLDNPYSILEIADAQENEPQDLSHLSEAEQIEHVITSASPDLAVELMDQFTNHLADGTDFEIDHQAVARVFGSNDATFGASALQTVIDDYTDRFTEAANVRDVFAMVDWAREADSGVDFKSAVRAFITSGGTDTHRLESVANIYRKSQGDYDHSLETITKMGLPEGVSATADGDGRVIVQIDGVGSMYASEAFKLGVLEVEDMKGGGKYIKRGGRK